MVNIITQNRPNNNINRGPLPITSTHLPHCYNSDKYGNLILWLSSMSLLQNCIYHVKSCKKNNARKRATSSHVSCFWGWFANVNWKHPARVQPQRAASWGCRLLFHATSWVLGRFFSHPVIWHAQKTHYLLLKCFLLQRAQIQGMWSWL